MSRQDLALNGGEPVRDSLLPYGRHTVTEGDIAAVETALRSDWLTTGPMVAEFENSVAAAAGVSHAVAIANGTAALHAMIAGIGVEPGDEVVVPVITFAATANAVLYCGGKPVFADVDRETLLMNPDSAAASITDRTRAIIAVDYAGQPADYDALRDATGGRDIRILADACHALGGALDGTPVGGLAEASTFSFHPVKHVAAGEGGAIVTDDTDLATAMSTFRNHGITTDHTQRAAKGTWTYDMSDLGFNYRLSDLQCALGQSQLSRLGANVQRRQEIAARYDEAFSAEDAVTPLSVRPGVSHAYHLYVILLNPAVLGADREEIFTALRAENIGVNVHYIPVPWHSYYQKLGYERGGWPVGEDAYDRMLTLPVWPGMTDRDVDDVVEAVRKVCGAYRR